MPALTMPGRSATAVPAPTAPVAGTGTTGNQGGQNVPAAAVVPFTRASVQKSRQGPNIGPFTLSASSQSSFGPYQIPSGGLFRSLRLNVNAVATSNAATVAFQSDGPWNVLQQVALLSASGGQIIFPQDGYALYLWNKYGVMAETAPGTDPKLDPNYSVTTGSGATGGSFNFNLRIPVEIDSRDALGVLPNMAGNALFQLQGYINTSGQVYSVAPTNLPTVTITVIYEFWALPEATNSEGAIQAQRPPGDGTAVLIQNQNVSGLAASSEQKIQLLNVGNIHRMYLFVLRNSSGARVSADWPNQVTRYVNGNPYNVKTKQNWTREIQKRYSLSATIDTAGGPDTGVFPWSDFVKDGDGGEIASSSCNRNEWPVTERASVLEFDFANWGANASTLLISTQSVTTPGPQQLYAPYVG